MVRKEIIEASERLLAASSKLASLKANALTLVAKLEKVNGEVDECGRNILNAEAALDEAKKSLADLFQKEK